MGVVALKIKVLPKSPETDLDDLKEKVKKALTDAGAIRINSIEKEPIAFGLNALIITLAWPEEEDTDKATNAAEVEGAGNVKLLDYRRAVG